MTERWVPIFASQREYEIQYVFNLLKEEEIPAVVMNKQDSMHIHLNERAPIEIHVKSEDVIRAKFLISNQTKE